jgi:hypothetical protein
MFQVFGSQFYVFLFKIVYIFSVSEAFTNFDILMIQDEPVSKKKIRAAGFKKLANHSFKKKDYFSAAGSYSLVC